MSQAFNPQAFVSAAHLLNWRDNSDMGNMLYSEPEQDTISRLMSQLKHPNYYVRCDAAYALGEKRDVRAIEPLIELLGETVFSPERPAMESEVKSRASDALAKIGSEAVPALINALADTQSDPEGKKRYWIIDALGLIRDKRAVEPLISSLKSVHRCIRESAIVSLGRIGASQALEPLINTFQNLQPLHGSLYFATAEALGNIGGKRALHVLEEALVNLHPESGYAYEVVSKAIQKIRAKQGSSG